MLKLLIGQLAPGPALKELYDGWLRLLTLGAH
jgi:hypothetical protein